MEKDKIIVNLKIASDMMLRLNQKVSRLIEELERLEELERQKDK